MKTSIEVVQYILVFFARWAGIDEHRYSIEFILPDSLKHFGDMHEEATSCYKKPECKSVAIVAIEQDKLFDFTRFMYSTSLHSDNLQDYTLLLSKCKDNNIPTRYDWAISRQYQRYSIYYLRTKASKDKLFYNPYGSTSNNVFVPKTFVSAKKASDYAKANLDNQFVKVVRARTFDWLASSN